MYINEDFNKEILERGKFLWDDVVTHGMNGNISYLQDRTVVVKNQLPS